MGVLKGLLGVKLWRSTDPLTYGGYVRQEEREQKRERRYRKQKRLHLSTTQMHEAEYAHAWRKMNTAQRVAVVAVWLALMAPLVYAMVTTH